jgi:hypothetical protein
MSAPPNSETDMGITPEMIAAGVAKLREPFVLIDLAEGWVTAQDTVIAVFRAMLEASRPST